jgi:hypothetical protein
MGVLFTRASENCTQTESLAFELLNAYRRTQNVYAVPALAVKVTST